MITMCAAVLTVSPSVMLPVPFFKSTSHTFFNSGSPPDAGMVTMNRNTAPTRRTIFVPSAATFSAIMPNSTSATAMVAADVCPSGLSWTGSSPAVPFFPSQATRVTVVTYAAQPVTPATVKRMKIVRGVHQMWWPVMPGKT
eukprot:TRINITY_DN1412_c0_g1_i2.p2 TRINITY_DN1412_c0_g1~~TRINITY_DN1412_c0_g1_i2.p2  ORF type:complete len:141 (+),score=23.87 TRINITY_DN1412_c0_g1_i2:1080-1502(+)